jgi:hypothetical protein
MHINYLMLIPWLLPIAVLILFSLFPPVGKSRIQYAPGNTYKYPVLLQVIVLAIFFSFLFGFVDDIVRKGWDWFVALPCFVYVLAHLIRMANYKVILGDHGLSWGAFWRKEVGYESIHSAELKTTRLGSTNLVVKYANKRRVTLSGGLQDFDDLARKLAQKVK